MGAKTGFIAGIVLFAGQAGVQTNTPLTEDGLRAWLVSGGAIESNRNLIHMQFEAQRAQLPPWWPKEVADQEEEALQSIDMVKVAFPFYQACFSDQEVRLLAKVTTTKAGKKVAQSALDTHNSSVIGGSSAESAQQAGEDAAASTAKTLSAQDRAAAMADFTPAEKAYMQKHFTSEWLAHVETCSDQAYAQTVAEMRQEGTAAVKAVVEKNRPQLIEARTAWTKEHPGTP